MNGPGPAVRNLYRVIGHIAGGEACHAADSMRKRRIVGARLGEALETVAETVVDADLRDCLRTVAVWLPDCVRLRGVGVALRFASQFTLHAVDVMSGRGRPAELVAWVEEYATLRG